MEAAQRRVGTTLCKKYRIDSVLGVGGMAAVYRGQHRNGHRVAVKMLHPQLSLNQNVCERFLKEGYVANAVEHPGAVRVTDDDTTEDGAAFLVMELLDGTTLASRLEKEGPLDARVVAELGHQLLDVLAAAHAKGIIHRDIKPENVFLTTDGQVKVLDFGIARMVTPGGPSSTRTGSMMGTPAFMPPEQALGLTREIDARTDVWAVGATLFALASGKLVHESETMEQMLVFAATKHARALSSVAPSVPAAIAAVIDRALAFEKTSRHADARAMQIALAEAYRAAYGAPMPAPFGPGSSRDPSHPAFDRTMLDPSGVQRAQPASSPAPAAPATGPGRTTAGVSAFATTDDPPAGVPSRGRTKVVLAAAVGAIVLLCGVGLVVSSWSSSAHGEKASGLVPPAVSSEPMSTSSVGVSTAVATAASTPSTTPSASSVNASPSTSAKTIQSTASPVVNVRPAATAATGAKPTTASASPPPSSAASPPASAPPRSCDPPFYIDPATGTRKVKPGC